MNERFQPAAGEKSLQVSLSGYDLINSPRLNKGTVFRSPWGLNARVDGRFRIQNKL